MQRQSGMGTGIVYVDGSEPDDLARAVERLSETEGVLSVELNHVTQTVVVTYDPRLVTFEDIRAISKDRR